MASIWLRYFFLASLRLSLKVGVSRLFSTLHSSASRLTCSGAGSGLGLGLGLGIGLGLEGQG